MKTFSQFLEWTGILDKPSKAQVVAGLSRGDKYRYLTNRRKVYVAKAAETYHGNMADTVGVAHNNKYGPLSGWTATTLTGFMNPADKEMIQKMGIRHWIATRHLAAKHEQDKAKKERNKSVDYDWWHGRYIPDPEDKGYSSSSQNEEVKIKRRKN